MAIALDLEAIDFDFQLAGLSRTVVTVPGATFAGQPTAWRVICRAISGAWVAEFPTAIVQSITWNPSGVIDEAEVDIPIDEPAVQQIRQDLSPHREIEIWRNDALLFVGPITTMRADSTTRMYHVSLKDPTWYLTRRNLGRPEPVNKLVNGSFESNGTNWTLVNGTGITDTFDTGRKYLGTKSLKLVGTNINAARYYKQVVVVSAGPLGMPLTLSGYCYIDHWLRPGAYGGGMLLMRQGVLPDPKAYSVAPVVATTPRNRWVRLQTSVRVKPNTTEYIEVWLFAIGGTIFWDNIRLWKGESLAFTQGEDQGVVVRDIVNYAQGKGRFGSLSPEKSDLRITAAMPTTGVEVTHRQYFLANRRTIFEGNGPGSNGILDEYLNEDNGIDWQFEPVGRILRGHYPSVGTTRSNVTFTWRYFPDEPANNSSWSVIGWTYGASIENAAGQVTMLGPQGGQAFSGDPSRETGGYDDNGAGLGGLTLEHVESAQPDARQSQLTLLATARGRQIKDPTATPTLILEEPRDRATGEVVYPLIGVLMPGDHIFVDVRDGAFTMQGEQKVAQVVLDAQAETLTVTPNPIHV